MFITMEMLLGILALIGSVVAAFKYHFHTIETLRKDLSSEFDGKIKTQTSECEKCRLTQERRMEMVMSKVAEQSGNNSENDKNIALFAKQIEYITTTIDTMNSQMKELTSELREVRETVIHIQERQNKEDL